MELPVVDISPFLQTDKTESSADAKKDCAKTLFDACHDTGFLYLKDHGIPPAITDEVLALARSFFLHASEEEKMSIARLDAGVDDGDSARGWQRLGDNVTKGLRDWHEAVDYYREEEGADGPPYKPLLGRNRWPKAPLRLRAAFEDYISRMLELGTAVVRAMGYALDPSREDVFVEQTRRSFWVLRMIGYPPLESSSAALHDGGETGISCGEHTDYGCLTFLLADSTQGALEVRHRSGTWIKADPLPGAFVVNIGDMIERWTNGLWKSTPHRVIHRGVNDWRISVPFFFEPDFDARVKPLTKFAEEAGGLPKYDEVLYGPYLQRKVESNFY